ncbi:hypothetical protein AABB24_021314 [Solanum stoloniferum]|uniref:Retrotransposon gag domain-containing protein n=1 Tax=Solanum stoloniferum TaxID=62892 RepID=A0ABD2SUQ4_9SOLN
MNTVAEELIGGIVYATSAHKIWEDLKERFDKVNRIRIYQLHREITTFAQGTNSISTYFSKLKSLWDEYDAIVPSPSYECLKSKDYVDHLYQLRLIQFLSGLNNSYDQARRQILLKSVSPTINQAYAMIIEDEIQHSAYLATVNNKIDPVIMQSSRNQTYAQGNQNFRGRKLQFEYCHLNSHTKDNCYKLIGYPTDWKHKKKNDYGNESYRGINLIKLMAPWEDMKVWLSTIHNSHLLQQTMLLGNIMIQVILLHLVMRSIMHLWQRFMASVKMNTSR